MLPPCLLLKIKPSKKPVLRRQQIKLFQKLVEIQRITRRYISEDRALHTSTVVRISNPT
jgi:hypothetical protein